MKVTLKTTRLQDMVSRASKGCGNNKLLFLTSLMAIRLKDHKLTLITTDATNYLYITEDKVEGDDFYVVVEADRFAKLVSRTTSENISLEVIESSLVFSGNGKYNIELPLDEEGQLIKYPDPVADLSFGLEPTTMHLSTMQLILATAKSALAVGVEMPCYTGYYVGDSIVTTDTYKMCGINVKLFDTPVLISPEMMNLFTVMSSETIEATRHGSSLLFSTADVTIYGSELPGIEDYQVEAINGLLGQSFSSVCKMSKDALLSTLDRLALFVGTYDKNGVYLTFTRDGLMINSKKSSGTELIKYTDSKDFKDFTCCIDIEMLQSQVKAQTGDVVEMWYGEDNAIKMTDGNVTQIVALVEDDR